MLKKVEIEAKTINEAMKKAVELLEISEHKINLEVLKEKRGLLGIGGTTTTYIASANVDLALEGKEYLEGIVSALDISVKMEYRNVQNNEIFFRIQSEDNGILIGREGRNLKALQMLLKTHLSMFIDEPLVVTLDVGDYRESRKKILEIRATKIAKQVAKSKIAVKLEPMNSYERRIIHAKLADWRDVETQSQGESEDRAVVIKPRKKY